MAKEIQGGFLAQPAFVASLLMNQLRADHRVCSLLAESLRYLSREHAFFEEIFAALLLNMLISLMDTSSPNNAILAGGTGMMKPIPASKDLQHAPQE